MKTVLVLFMTLGSMSAFAVNQLVLEFSENAKQDFLEKKILTSEDFKGNKVEILENTSLDYMTMKTQEKYGPITCYEGDLIVAEKILQKMISNSENKYGRYLTSKSFNLNASSIFVSLNDSPEGGCGLGRIPCWNIASEIKMCSKP